MPLNNPDKEISLLELLKNKPEAGQRDMAEALGLSLGMTNLLLKQLASKGWMMVRKINARTFQYLLTPEGVKELSLRSYGYLKRSIRGVAECRVRLEALVAQVKQGNHRGLALVGASELDFVLEFLCQKHGLPFMAVDAAGQAPGWYAVHGEGEPADKPNVLEFVGMELA